MAKGLGLIGNFRGKFGNAVGYNLKDSNNKQTQGIRIYQPIVKNPKTYAQSEQRAKLAPINATYRWFKAVIERGQESTPYGNKSRLAWLRDAIKEFNGGWFVKGAQITFPAIVTLSKGSLNVLVRYSYDSMGMPTMVIGSHASEITTYGALSSQLLANYPALKAGDQVTVVGLAQAQAGLYVYQQSFVLETTSAIALPTDWEVNDTTVTVAPPTGGLLAYAIIISREGDNGAHLRSTSKLVYNDRASIECMTETAKEAAISSYRTAGTSTDWPEVPAE